MANRQPDEYPRKPDEYPEIMSKMDPLIIRVSPTVLLVGSTTYTAKIKLGYRFNGFHVNVTGVGIPIYKEEIDIGNKSTTNKSATGNSDAYDYVEKKACAWMDELEKSMINDSKEKNVVDLLREIKYQMHFDASGHKYPAIVPGTDEYDARMEVCTEVPTYIEDLYTMLLQITIRLDNLTSVINGGQLKELREDSVEYDQETGKFVYHEDSVGNTVKGLNERIEELNDSIGTGKDEGQTKESLQSRITKLQESIGNSSDGTVISKLNTIGTNVDTVATDIVNLKVQTETNASTVANRLAPEQNNIYSAVQILVGQMQSMNSKMGQAGDSYDSATLFGKMNLTNTRIGTPSGDSDTVLANIKSVKTDVSGLPTFISNHSDTLSHIGSALYNNWGPESGSWTIRTSADGVITYDQVPWSYYSGPTATERGYQQLSSNKVWAVRIARMTNDV